MITLFIVFFLRLTVVRGTQAAMYKERMTLSCGMSGGWGKMTSATACEAGAAALGWGNMTAITVSTQYSPSGCFLSGHTLVIAAPASLYFNTNFNIISMCKASHVCLCTNVCPPGRYQDQTGQSICKYCASGKYSIVGASSCPFNATSCPAGTYASGTAACDSCPSGTYSIVGGTASCEACASGKYQGQSGQVYCKTCASGKYNDQVGQSSESSCKTCATGQYNAQEGQPSCKTCPDGQLQFQSGQSSCDSCTNSSEKWVNSVGDIQQSVGKFLGGEAKIFTVTGTLKAGTLTIGNKTLEEYIKSVIEQ